MNMKKHAATVWFFGLTGTICILLATSQSVGLSPDSADYIGAARSLLSGKGFMVPGEDGQWKPLVWYPPLFPGLLAIPGLVGIDPLVGARWVNAFFFGANIVAVGSILRVMSPAFHWPAIFGSFLVLTSTEMYENHAMAWSEPAFIFFVLLCLAALALYLESCRGAFLIVAAVSAGLAFSTRYVGMVLLFVGGFSLLFLSRRAQRNRIFDALLFGTIASAPAAIWLARIRLLHASVAGGREVGKHIVSQEVLGEGLTNLASWFLPSPLSGPTSGGLLLCGATLLIILAVKASGQNGTNTKPLYFVFVLTIFVLAYVAFVILSISVVEPFTHLDNRILAPVYVVALIILIWAIAQLGESMETPRFVRTSVLSFLAIVTLMHLGNAPGWILRDHYNGAGYGSTEWRASRLIEYVRNLPADTIIFSNAPDAIYLLTNRMTKSIPRRPVTELALTAMRADDARLVYFKSIDWRSLTLEELKRELSLQVDLDEEDGEALSNKVTR
jgi:hypothetical protein